MSGEVWTFPPIVSDVSKSRSQNNLLGALPLLPQYPSQNNHHNVHQNVVGLGNNGNNGAIHERNTNSDHSGPILGEENRKFKVSVSFDR